MNDPLTLKQNLICCLLSLGSTFAWFGLAIFTAIAISGPENGDGETANLILVLCLPGCALWLVVLFFTTTYFERRNDERKKVCVTLPDYPDWDEFDEMSEEEYEDSSDKYWADIRAKEAEEQKRGTWL